MNFYIFVFYCITGNKRIIYNQLLNFVEIVRNCMRNKPLKYILLALIFPVVFNLIFYMSFGAEQPSSVWVSYGFIHFAYVLIIFTPVLCKHKRRTSTNSKTIFVLAGIYFFASFVVALVFIFLKPESIISPLLAQIVLFGIYSFLLLSSLFVNVDSVD